MRALRFVLKAVLGIVAAFVAVILAITALMAVGVIKPDVPKPPFPSVVVSSSAPQKRVAAPAPLPERPCVLQTDGVKHIALFPNAAAAQAFHDVVMAADGLTMLDAPGVFEVVVGTRCVMVDLGSKVSRVRIAEGERAGELGWIQTDWVMMR